MNIFKIILPDKGDVKDAKLEDEVLDSLYPSPKINTKATPPHAGIIRLNWNSSIAVPLGTTRVLYSFPHGYDYVPTVFATNNFDNGSIRTKGTLPFQYGSLGMITMDADPKNINLKYFSLDLASTTLITPFLMQIRYYVLAERGYADE